MKCPNCAHEQMNDIEDLFGFVLEGNEPFIYWCPECGCIAAEGSRYAPRRFEVERVRAEAEIETEIEPKT